MSVTPDDHHMEPDVVAAAREFIRQGDGCIVSISEVLEELSEKSGGRVPVSPDVYKVIDLISVLWADPHIDQVPYTGDIEFAWCEGRSDPSRSLGLKARLRSDSHEPSVVSEN